jgi:hypothetical protein
VGATTAADEAVASPWRNLFADDRATAAGSVGATTAADEAVASCNLNGGGHNFLADDRATAAGSVGATTAADEAVASCNLNGGGHNFLADDRATAAGSVGATTAADEEEAVACAWRKTFCGGGHDGCLGRSGLAFSVGMGGKAAGSGGSQAAGATCAGSVDNRNCGTTGCRPLMLLAGGRGGVLGTAGRFRSPLGDALSAG